MKNETIIKNYIDHDNLAIQIRRAGGSAWVENRDEGVIVITNRSPRWVVKLCKSINFISPIIER